ncbi:nucleotidyltransferase domain-containing protein [Pantoea agglomerans]|uniref:nucleotidyltransferase domain-containing protein n=1 Tax=Enterobacter agglomerans TaxID=549 RepID=UPI0012AD45BC|nr:nucleotidyltransferase domain-containing protein [Pantoea agglomerans]MRT09681.1 nucleotidyltransferase [Pantoea agglomerans]UJQ24898.1 nucleotidyltransferase domain-containing protein [Pantoea agglomerans]
MHIYAFGSLCRGEVSKDSDVDILALVDGRDERFGSHEYSVYSYGRIIEMWAEGNPFAWHLFLESKLIFSADGDDFLRDIGKPHDYVNFKNDYLKFKTLLDESLKSLKSGTKSYIFEMSNIFLAVRNISICYSLACSEKPIFSRAAAQMLSNKSIKLPLHVYNILERSRILSTRGMGEHIKYDEALEVIKYADEIINWTLLLEVNVK